MHSCIVEAPDLERLRYLIEIKATEIYGDGSKIYQMAPKKIIRRDLFGFEHVVGFRCALSWKKEN